MALHRSLLARLHHDLSELLTNPYPGVRVFTDDANIRRFCLVLTPPSGPWKDLSLHFDVELPNGWPSSPPMIFSSVEGIKHPNISGNWICCDLLKEQAELEMGYSGGYTPALTLRGLFLQFLTFFSSTKVEQTNGSVIDIGDYKLVKYVLDPQFDLSKPETLHSLWIRSQHTEYHDHAQQGIDEATKRVCIPLRKIESINPRWHTAFNLVNKFKCKKCPYNTPPFPVHAVVPPSPPPLQPLLISRSPPPITGYLTPSSLPSPISPTPTQTKPSAPLLLLPRNPRRRRTGCTLDMLPSDLLLLLATYLPTSTDLLALSTAYPRFHALTLGHSQLTHKMLFADELRCFFLRTPLNPGLSSLTTSYTTLLKSGANIDMTLTITSSPTSSPSCPPSSLPPSSAIPPPSPPILGIGISFSPTTRTLTSDFDFLSSEAYHDHGVRLSVQKRKFAYFLPLALGRDHFERAKEAIWEGLGVLDGVVAREEARVGSWRRKAANGASRNDEGRANANTRRPLSRPCLYISPPQHPWQTVRVIYRMMNNIVVSLMKTCDGVLEWERREQERRRRVVEERRERRVGRRAERRLRGAGVNGTMDGGVVGLGLGLGGGGAEASDGGLSLFASSEVGGGGGEDDLETDALGLLTFDAPPSTGAGTSQSAVPPAQPTPLPTQFNSSSSDANPSKSNPNSPPPTLLHASERSIISYLHLFHLLLCLCRSEPRILEEARMGIHEFIRGGKVRVKVGGGEDEENGKERAEWWEARGKERVGNLGEFIVRVMVVLAQGEDGDGHDSSGNGTGGGEGGKKLSWSQINGPFLEEAITRNVFWYLKSLPVLECIEEGGLGKSEATSSGISGSGKEKTKEKGRGRSQSRGLGAGSSARQGQEHLHGSEGFAEAKEKEEDEVTASERFRLEKTFETSLTSLRLIMFQVAFLEVFVGAHAGGNSTTAGSTSSTASTATTPKASTYTSTSTSNSNNTQTSSGSGLYNPYLDSRSLLTRLDASYGYPPDPSIPARMVKSIKAIYGVRTWPSFFERVRWRRGMGLFQAHGGEDVSADGVGIGGSGGGMKATSSKFVQMLRDAVKASADRGYHIPRRPREMHLLWRERENMERMWLRERMEREREVRERGHGGGAERDHKEREKEKEAVREREQREKGEGLGLGFGLGLGLVEKEGKSGGKEVRWV